MNTKAMETAIKEGLDMAYVRYGGSASWSQIAECLTLVLQQHFPEPSVPAGWKLVPLIPTKEMIEASCKGPGMTMINNMLSAYQIRAGLIDEKAIKFRDDGKPAIQEAYEAMLAVAPEPKEKP